MGVLPGCNGIMTMTQSGKKKVCDSGKMWAFSSQTWVTNTDPDLPGLLVSRQMSTRLLEVFGSFDDRDAMLGVKGRI